MAMVVMVMATGMDIGMAIIRATDITTIVMTITQPTTATVIAA
jgi:hypothetical protein